MIGVGWRDQRFIDLIAIFWNRWSIYRLSIGRSALFIGLSHDGAAISGCHGQAKGIQELVNCLAAPSGYRLCELSVIFMARISNIRIQRGTLLSLFAALELISTEERIVPWDNHWTTGKGRTR